MPEVSYRLNHLPFFEALADLEESSAEWRETLAGLLMLRLVDAWTAGERANNQPERSEVSAVGEAVDGIDPGNVLHGILKSVIHLATTPGEVSATTLPQLLAYGRTLEFGARWTLAVDVYETVLAHPGCDGRVDVASAAAFQLGYCRRMMGALDEAAHAYAYAHDIAAAEGDMDGVLRAQVAQANLVLHRGNLPRAEAMLDRTIAGAEAASCTEVLSRALHDRAHVAYRRGHLEDSIVYGYRALRHCTDPTERDRVLADIATSLAELGHREAAREVHLVLAATAQEQYVRWVATLNLLEIAILDGSEPLFERYRRELADAELPPALGAYYQLFSGDGYRRFGNYRLAHASLARALSAARDCQANEIAIKAEAALAELERSGVALARRPAMPSPAVTEVLRAIRAMREGIGFAGD